MHQRDGGMLKARQQQLRLKASPLHPRLKASPLHLLLIVKQHKIRSIQVLQKLIQEVEAVLGDVLLELRMVKARTLARDVEKDLRKQLQDLRSSLCPLGLIRSSMFGDLRGSSIDLSLLLCLY